MEIIGTILKISPDVKRGVSDKTGKAWAMRDIVLEVHDTYVTKEGVTAAWAHTFVFTLLGESAESFSLTVGTKVKIRYYADHREYDGKYYERKHVRSIELSA